MLETDLVAMMMLIFLPILAGIVLLPFGDRGRRSGRAVALLATASTVSLALCVVVSYYAMLDSRLDRTGRPLHASENRLDARMDALASADAASPPRPRHHEDWVARKHWIERFDIWFALGLDGISLALILTAAVIAFVAVLVGWKSSSATTLGLMLILEGGIHGCLLAMDLFLFYLFLQAVVVPVWFLLRVRPPGDTSAPSRPPTILLAADALILLAIVGMYGVDVRDFVDRRRVEAAIEDSIVLRPGLSREDASDRAEIHTFDLVTLQRAGRAAFLIRTGQVDRIAAKPTAGAWAKRDRTAVPDPVRVELLGAGADPEAAKARYDQTFFAPLGQYLLFAALLLGFAAPMGLFPLHSWFVGAVASAPTPAAMVVGGAFLKVGAYGLLRLVWPICPWPVDRASDLLCVLAVASMVYGIVRAARQTDLTRIVAYLSVAQMGYVLLGLSVCADERHAASWTWGANGATFHLLAHGINASALLLVAGAARRGRSATDGPSTLAFLGLMGMPGLCGFVGFAFVVLGAWPYSPILAVATALTMAAGARLLFGTWARLSDRNRIGSSIPSDSRIEPTELAALSILLLLSLILGVAPQMAILSWVEPSVTGLVENLSRLRP